MQRQLRVRFKGWPECNCCEHTDAVNKTGDRREIAAKVQSCTKVAQKKGSNFQQLPWKFHGTSMEHKCNICATCAHDSWKLFCWWVKRKLVGRARVGGCTLRPRGYPEAAFFTGCTAKVGFGSLCDEPGDPTPPRLNGSNRRQSRFYLSILSDSSGNAPPLRSNVMGLVCSPRVLCKAQ